jgi:hypothetical protein
VNENLGANSKYEFSKPKGIKETIFAWYGIVAGKAVTMRRPRDRQIYQYRFQATAC